MPKFSCTVIFDASKGIDVEAENAEEAAQLAEDQSYVSLCHQCSRDVEIADSIGVLVYDQDGNETDTTYKGAEIAKLKAENASLLARIAELEKDRTGRRWSVGNQTDREMLELAAKAAGLSIVVQSDLSLYVATEGCCGGAHWNPLTDSGDALDLAVRIGMQIETPKHAGWGATANPLDGSTGVTCFVGHDACARTRRAIVMAAANTLKPTTKPENKL